MKTIITILITLIISMSCLSQNEAMSYKALIKDDNGLIVANQSISLKFIISRGIGEEVIYEEEHVNVDTNSNGIIIVNIGEGAPNPSSGNFMDIDWYAFEFYTNLRTEIDLTGGTSYQYLGQSIPFKTVPYAKLADDVKNQAFKVEDNVIIPKENNNDFVVGSNQLDYGGSNIKRLFFDKSKGAFRVGSAGTNVWDTANIGQNSFASGSGTKASGNNSTAMGTLTEATSTYSVAFGDGSKATGIGATAMGENTEALGPYSTAMGSNTEASGGTSTAMGSHTIASTSSSTAMGSYNVDVPNAILMVGNGFSGTRRNAVTVLFNGNVGIGVDNPTSKLQLNGQIKFGNAAYIDVGSGNNFDIRINGNIRSTIDNVDNLGSSSFRYNTVYATNGTINTSDRRDKTNITSLDYGLEAVMQLKPVKFNWKNKPNADKKLGLIAQDLYSVIPEVVSTQQPIIDGDGRSKTNHVVAERMGVYYSDLIPVLIKAIQEQQAIIDSQATENTKQNQAIQSLLERMTALEAANN